MVCGEPPAVSALVLIVAVNPLKADGAWATPSIVNVTLPVGVPAPGAVTLTVAVKVTDCPITDGFALELTAVVVAALFTVKVPLPLLPVKPPLGVYVAFNV